MSATPLLSIIKKGTFITFQSSAEDMNNVFVQSDSQRKFTFSKFALLNLPDIRQDGFDYTNVMCLNNIEGHYINGLNNLTPMVEKHKLDFSESFQNYVMNMESLLTSSKEYDRSLPRNCAERIFFKWLKECGVLRFREDMENISSQVQSKRFTEDILDENYSRIVNYIGEVEMQGSNLASNENSFNEVYLNIPTISGSTPCVLFQSISDKNYNEETVIVNSLNSEFINGREESINPTSAGLTIEAIYDQDVQFNGLTYTTNGEEGRVWYEEKITNGPNAYYTDTVFDDATTDLITRSKKDGSDKVVYYRSRLDGISLDFDVSNYRDVEDYNKNNQDKVLTFNQYNSFDSSNNFDFNVVLLYYDVYDPENPEGDTTTNLYGVLFLNDIVSTGTITSKFKTIGKIRQDNFISQQGNGFGLKLNFKFDVSTNMVDKRVEISVNDYNTFSMSLFIEAVNNMVLMNRDYEKMLMMNKDLINQIENYHELIENSDISMLVSKLKELITENPTEVEHQGITSLLESLQRQINDVLKGKTNVEVSYLIDLAPEDGIVADYKNNELRIGNSRQEYFSSKVFNFDCSSNNSNYITNEIPLEKFTNLIVHKNNFEEKTAQGNLAIRIDDSNIKWSTNQTVKIVFSDPIDFDGKGILIYTDSNDNFKMGSRYGKLIGIIDEINTKYPVIEIVCLDSEKYEFVVFCK